MPPGIRTTVEFTGPELCPAMRFSETTGASVESMAANVRPSDGGESVSEFSITENHDPGDELTPVFSHGSTQQYRYTHDEEVDCPCECLGQFGCPVVRYVVRDDTLTIVFHATDYEELREIVADLRDRFPGVDIKRFVRSPAGEQPADSVLVDRGRLTDRQLEVLETAHEMGYFEHPRRANATEVATALDITQSTFREHLAAAETKLLSDIL